MDICDLALLGLCCVCLVFASLFFFLAAAAAAAPLVYTRSNIAWSLMSKSRSHWYHSAVLTTAAVQLRLYHRGRMQWINIGYLSAASLHLLHQLSLPSRSEETQVSQLLFPCAIRLWTYSYRTDCLKYLFLCMLRSFSCVTVPSLLLPLRIYREFDCCDWIRGPARLQLVPAAFAFVVSVFLF